MTPIQELIETLAKARELDLSASALQTLCILTAGPARQSDLAEDLLVSTSAINSIADRLEHLGYAERQFNRSRGKDRRVVRLAITHHGVSALEDILAAASLPR